MVSIWKLLQGRGPRQPQDRVPVTESKSWRGHRAQRPPAQLTSQDEGKPGVGSVGQEVGVHKTESRAGALAQW